MASVTFDKASRIYPGSTRASVDKLDLQVDLIDGGAGRPGGDAGCLVECDRCHGCTELLHRQVRAGRSVVNG